MHKHTLSSLVLWFLYLWHSAVWSVVTSILEQPATFTFTFTYTLQMKAARSPDMLLTNHLKAARSPDMLLTTYLKAARPPDMLLTTYLNPEHHSLTPSQLHFVHTLPWTSFYLTTITCNDSCHVGHNTAWLRKWLLTFWRHKLLSSSSVIWSMKTTAIHYSKLQKATYPVTQSHVSQEHNPQLPTPKVSQLVTIATFQCLRAIC
jgi:hypothetical protein